MTWQTGFRLKHRSTPCCPPCLSHYEPEPDCYCECHDKVCACLDFIGDNEECPIHGKENKNE